MPARQENRDKYTRHDTQSHLQYSQALIMPQLCDNCCQANCNITKLSFNKAMMVTISLIRL